MSLVAKVGLFVTCPVDLFRPGVGFSAVSLLQDAGCEVEVPPQSCCGQVNYNNGAPGPTKELAWAVVERFEPFDYTVLPSGSCAGMMRTHYPELFRGDFRESRVNAFCERVFELTTFLVEVANYQPAAATTKFDTITYHDSCAGLRELQVKKQPRELLERAGICINEMEETEVCCGFGGTFCVKFPEVSSHMADAKINNAISTGATTLVGGDFSCLLHLAARAKSRGVDLSVRHVAEVLAENLAAPAGGEGST